MLSLAGQWPAYSHGKTKPWYSGTPGLRHGRFRLRGYHPLRRGFPAHFGYRPPAVARAHTPHLPAVFPRGFGLGSPPFGRPYSGGPCWLPFLRVLRCFRSPRSRPLRGAGAYSAPAGSPIRGSRVLSLPAAPPGLSQLATPFFGARAEPSTGRLCRAERRLAGPRRSPLDYPPPGGGDPAAGSPTATLLRLHPPWEPTARPPTSSARGLAEGSLGWCDGRCVQGAGTYSPRVGDTRLLGIPRSRGRVAALDPYWGGVYGIASPFRGRIPLSPPLQLACSPGVSGHTDLPWPPPSSGLRRQSP